jgi:MFS family permease
MIAAVTLSGVALYVALGPYVALLADVTPVNQRGRIGGLMALAGVVGAVLFTVLSMQFWESARGWVFLLTALGVVGSLTVVALGVHEPPSITLRVKSKERAVWREIVRIRPLAVYVAAMTIYWLGAGAASPFITRFGVHELGISESNSFTLLLVIVLSTAVGALLAGVLADKIGKREVLQPALVLFAVAAIVGSQVPNIAWALPVMVMVGLGNAAPTALHLPLLADLVPKDRAGAFMGFASMIWSVAQPVGSLLAGVLVDLSGSYRGVFLFAGVCMAASVLIMRGMAKGANREP